jgi:hypothetical protein
MEFVVLQGSVVAVRRRRRGVPRLFVGCRRLFIAVCLSRRSGYGRQPIAASAAGVGFEFDLATLFEELAEADDQGMVLSPTVVLCGSENDGASVSCENVTSFLPVGVTLENLLQFLHASSGETDWTLSLQQRFGNELTQTQLSVMNLILKGMDLAERCVVASRKERDGENSNASGTDNFNKLLFLNEAVYSHISDS